MKPRNITPENTEFVFLSFEGPDIYSLAGGLGVRIDHLCRTLADIGFTTHLFFIGDPSLPGEEVTRDGKLILHRWCQWLSKYYPKGVYDGEAPKLGDFTGSIPGFIKDHVVKPAVARGKMVAILGEEWQTAEAMCRLSDALYHDGVRDRAIMFWNANNTYYFELVNWARLNFTTTLTTVSRYMKHLMGRMGLNPLVIPNGIPKELLQKVDDNLVRLVRQAFDPDMVLCKVARWHPDKRWSEAIKAVAMLKEHGSRPVLLAIGGMEGYGLGVLDEARAMGLVIKEAAAKADSFDARLSALAEAMPADIIVIKSHLTLDFLAVVYRAADAVLANSGHEPFGIVGLEAMAAGGVAFTGNTGEDYIIPFVNAIMVETADPQEIVGYLMYLHNHPEECARMRNVARMTARYFTWRTAVQILLSKLENQAEIQGLLDPFSTSAPRMTPAYDMASDIFRHPLSASIELEELLCGKRT